MNANNHPHTPPFYRPLYYTYQAEKARHQQARTSALPHWRNQAIFQGLLALSWVALGRHALNHGYPFTFFLSMAGMQGAVQQHTKALSCYLSHKKSRKIGKI